MAGTAPLESIRPQGGARRYSLIKEIAFVTLLAFGLTLVAWFLPNWLALDVSRRHGLFAVWYCATVTIGCLPWRHPLLSTRLPLISIVIPMTWRIATLAGIVLWASATKWPSLNVFALQLVGFYFIFLALESTLAIRKHLVSRH